MKPVLLFLLLFLGINSLSQPQLLPVYQLPDPPELTVSQLIKYDDIVSFKHKEGLVIYDSESDQWKLFKYLDQQEELGRIINIQKLKHYYVVSLEKGGVIISGSKIEVFNSSIISSFEIKDKILVLSSEINSEGALEDYFHAFDYFEADHILLFDPKKDETDTIRLSRPIYSVKSCELFKDHLWIYAFDEESEYWFPELLKVDLKGNVTSIDPPGTNFNLIRSLKVFEDHLFILRDSSMVSYSENNAMKIIMDIVPIDRNDIVKNYETGFYIFKSRSRDGSNDIIGYTQIDLSFLTSRETLLPVSHTTREKIYTDCRIYHDKLFKYCDYLQQVQSLEMSEPALFKDYNIRDGITDHIENLTEDEKETWFICTFSGIHRYIKSDSTWINYTQYLNYQDDTAGVMAYEVLTINEDFVFIPLISENKGIMKYLLFDRQNETFIVLTKEEFIRKFLYDGERFVSYTGEYLTKNPPNILEHIIDYNGDVWNLLLFLYELPISGNFSYDLGNLIISNNYCTILSYMVRQPRLWYDGILIKLKHDSTIYFRVADKTIQDFDEVYHPYIIGGDAYRVFAASRGNFAHGLLIYDLPTQECKTDKNFYSTLSNFSFLQGTGKYVIIGSFYPNYRLYALDVQTYELTNLSKYINSTPRNCKSTENCIYVATDHGLVYFDHDLNYIGKLFPGQCVLSRTKLNLYLIAKDKVYLVEDDKK